MAPDVDDALCCTGLTIFTRAWLDTYDPGAPPGYAVVCDRHAAEPYGPMSVPEHLLAEFIAVTCPPTVTIRHARGEDVRELQALVELATAEPEGGAMH